MVIRLTPVDACAIIILYNFIVSEIVFLQYLTFVRLKGKRLDTTYLKTCSKFQTFEIKKRIRREEVYFSIG